MSVDPQENALIAEFDSEVKTRVEMMQKNTENTAQNMKNALDLILTSLPACIRQMPMKALIMNFGGDIQKATAYFTPSARSSPRPKPQPKAVSRKQPRLGLSQTLSLSDLLKQKAASELQTSPSRGSQNRSPNARSPGKRPQSPRTQTKSPVKTRSGIPRTPPKR